MKQKKHGKKGLAVLLGAAFFLLSGYLILCKATEDDVIWREVTVNGVSLKGKTLSQAEAELQDKFREEYQEASFSVELDGKEYRIPVFSLLELDPSAELEEAYELGHGIWILRGLDWIRQQVFPREPEELQVLPAVAWPERLEESVEASGILEHDSRTGSSWAREGDLLILHKGTTGVAANQEALEEELLAALERKEFFGEFSCPFRETVPEALDFQKIGEEVYCEPVSAALDPEAGYDLVPSAEGFSLDQEEAEAAFEAAPEGADLEIPLTVTQPEITTEEMEEHLFETVLGSYESRVTGEQGKKHNIALAAQLCDRIILLPGEEFSYNRAIGDTTLERGFALANAYYGDQVVKEPGGGVCQVSSTIYSALLQTDLEVVERRNHSLVVTYVPFGMDATVSWTEPDFRFQNNHRYPVRLSVEFSGDVIFVQIIGTRESSLTVDCVVEQTGELSYKTYRDYYDETGTLVEREYIDSSRYKPLP